MARLPLVDPEALPEQYDSLDDVPEMYRDEVGIDEDWLNTRNVLRAMGNNPELLAFHNNAFLALWGNTGLEPRETELAVLVVASDLDSSYEWQHHYPRAESAGITDDEKIAIAEGRFDVFEGAERALIEYVKAFVNQAVTDEIHDDLAEYYSEETIVGIQVLAGYYALTALVIDAMDVELEAEEFVGWTLENA